MFFATAIFFVFSLFYNYITPYETPAYLHVLDGGMANPDEHDHFKFVTALASTGKLPEFGERGGNEAHQPPLYYILAAGVYRLSPSPHSVRLLSTALGVGLLWALYAGASVLARDRRKGAWTALLCMLIPMNAALCGSINNDVLANLIFAVAFWRFALASRLTKTDSLEVALREAAIIGIVIALGIYSKMSAAMLFPAALLFWILMSAYGRLSRSIAIKAGGASIGLALLLAAPWFYHNYAISGDILGVGKFLQVLQSQNFSPQTIISKMGASWYWEKMFLWTPYSYWGFFDSMNLHFKPQVYNILFILSFTSLFGLRRVFKERMDDTGFRVVFWVLIVSVALNFLGFIQYNLHFFQAQGRYFFPSLLPFTLAFSLGLEALAPQRYKSLVMPSLAGLLTLINILALTMIRAWYS